MQQPVGENASESINPVSGERIAVWPFADAARIEATLVAATRAAHDWRRRPLAERAAFLRSIATQLRLNSDRLARMITLEMGKPLAEARGEVEKSAWNCEYVAEHGATWLADEEVVTQARRSYVSFQPLGPVFAILPWNFPVWQGFRCATAALMAGNVFILKHAPNVQGCANLVTELFQAAGFPPGVFQNLHAAIAAIGAIIADPRVAVVTLTGSPMAGAKVAAQAGAACKKSIMELGGSDPFIVLADADFDAAVSAAVRARFSNCGQVCLAAKRFIVEASVATKFTEAFAAAAAALRIGDPLEASTQLGPMARADLRDNLDAQLQASLHAGARLVTGGKRPAGAGWFYTPTVVTDVTQQMPVVAQETFGPVAAVLTARDAADAVAIANDSPFGLSAMVWTSPERGQQMARTLDVGGVFINSVTMSDPRLPVGGVKLSGYGRELGRLGMLDMCNAQTVWVA